MAGYCQHYGSYSYRKLEDDIKPYVVGSGCAASAADAAPSKKPADPGSAPPHHPVLTYDQTPQQGGYGSQQTFQVHTPGGAGGGYADQSSTSSSSQKHPQPSHPHPSSYQAPPQAAEPAGYGSSSAAASGGGGAAWSYDNEDDDKETTGIYQSGRSLDITCSSMCKNVLRLYAFAASQIRIIFCLRCVCLSFCRSMSKLL